MDKKSFNENLNLLINSQKKTKKINLSFYLIKNKKIVDSFCFELKLKLKKIGFSFYFEL